MVSEALRANQESLEALTKLQQQTAELHRRFLENQEQAARNLEQLLARQQSGFGTGQLGDGFPPASPLSVPKIATPVPMTEDATPVLLDVVAEKTGYPVDMLELSMGLDSDLGIDSIKRVEILSALQDKLPAAPAVKPEHLGELTTLGHIADFLNAGGSASITASTASGLKSGTPAAGETSGIESILLGVVAEKTGYPVDMLDLSMGLDADLGIDSIKRVEILSALQDQLPDAPIVKPEHLGELTTLADILAFLGQIETATGSQSSSSAEVATPATDTDHLAQVVLAIVADKTGYPAEMLELSMGLDADLGIDSIKRVEILSAVQEQLPDAPVVKPEHLGELQTLQHIIEFLACVPAQVSDPIAESARPVVQPPVKPGITRLVVARRQIEVSAEVVSDLPARALVWVTRTDDGLSQAIVERLRQLGVKADEVERTTRSEPPGELSGLIVVADATPQARFLHESFAVTRHCAARLRQTGEQGDARYVTVSRLDGSFGLRGLGGENVLSGGLAGLAKTVSHEWPQVGARALDIDGTETDSDWLAERIAAQFLADVDHRELGISRQGACVLETLPEDLPPLGTDYPAVLTGEDVVLITGGARGVTAEVAVALAAAFGPRLVLIGRSPAPTPEPEWLRDLQDDTSIKQAILEQSRVDDPDAQLTPKNLNERFASITNNREILRNVSRMEDAGSTVVYHSVDVRDPAALAACFETVRNQQGPVSGLIHGAGVLADSYISDKTDEEFARVLATKVDGAQALLTTLRTDNLKVIVQFASSTARYGRTGQADYAVANEVLNKLAQRESRQRPDCRIVSVNWGPWDGGMVTPALREMFADEGISVIDQSVGAEYLVQELCNPGGSVEVVILGQGSVVPAYEESESVLVPALSALPELPTILERRLCIEDHPVLASHILDGKAVLPAAVIIELLGHGALHGNPGLRLLGFHDLRVFKGVLLSADETCDLRICADQAQKRDGTFSVVTELCSSDPEGARTLHARATIDLGTTHEIAPRAAPAAVLPPYPLSIEEAYRDELFHGTLLQGLSSISGCSTDDGPDVGIIAHCQSAPAPKEWIHHPLRSRWIADPLAIDCGFQLMILWSLRANGQGSLPVSIGHYQQFVNAFGSDGVRIEIRVKTNAPGKVIADIDWLDHKGDLLARMTDYECVVDASLSRAFKRNSLESSTAVRR
ncbi:MAG: SDR family NAD(P)-dependent oxidoreductase [Planctomycetota bacterium]|nr:SDR family NAD(P)-dependent oxidoreductase [Planctomycetota bacterium]